MSSPIDSNRPLPAPAPGQAEPALPRVALERVLARATELQADGGELSDAVSESRLMEIAREVGIDTTHLRQALAEERARLPMQEAEHGVVLDALGPASVSVQRVVPGTPAEVLAKLEAWMPRMESLTLRRRVVDRISWEPSRDAIGNFLRSLGMGGRRQDLVRLDQVVASVTAVDATRSVVRFDAESFAARRTQRTSILSIVLVLVLMALGLSVPLALLAGGGIATAGMAGVAAFASGLGYFSWRAIRRGYRQMIDRTHLRLEQLLDELESGGMQPPPSLARQVTAALLR
ncbi:MAG: hypothetical protein IPP90_01780 [Gemmatimonadaceae bacterium]|nr:hypothetical protein [Gemmatimonadaceae bacterium]